MGIFAYGMRLAGILLIMFFLIACVMDIIESDKNHALIIEAQTQEELGAACHDYMAYPADEIPFRCTQFIGE